MTLTNLTVNETKIASEATKFDVALDFSHEYAAQVGIIVSLFSLIEGYHPLIVSKICGVSKQDSSAMLGVFRAFSNRNDLLNELARARPAGSPERECLSYFQGRLTEANKIRNWYAHATYSYAKTHFVIHPFSGDFNRTVPPVEVDVSYMADDAAKLRRIICELHAFCWRNEISAALHKILAQQRP